jgi:hypothetical protein
MQSISVQYHDMELKEVLAASACATFPVAVLAR